MIMLPLPFAHAHNVENHHTMEDNFALRYVLGYPDVNSQAELVLSLGLLRPERRFAPLGRGIAVVSSSLSALCDANNYYFTLCAGKSRNAYLRIF